MYTNETIGDAVGEHIRHKYKRQKVAAAQWGIGQSMVSQVVKGARRPSAVILTDMGLTRREIYEPAAGSAAPAPTISDRIEKLERIVESLDGRTVGLVRYCAPM